ncbi:MAG: BatA and WFA domain-containing protein [Acidobacteria bacterium]|nr:BatA and WFA domain-containing protein [Acidobacteriota bacterium]
MPVFSFPVAFFALLAVPVLVAIYFLRNRAKERQVSSLLLWMEVRQRWDGGQRIHKLQTPLLFFLELLAVLLLVMAAAKPLMRTGESARPLMVVLDDSFSMLAGGEESSRQRAISAIQRELRSNRYEPVRFVLAGEAPQLLGEATGNTEQAIRLLENWKCGAASAKLEDAISFAFELGGNRARVLVLSDHAPAQEPTDSRLQWWAFGSSLPNLAFTAATRSARGDEERVLLEVTNLSSQSTSATLSIETIGSENPQSAIRNSQSFSLAANESRRITLTLKNSSSPIKAKLGNDALAVDNEIVLMPEASKIARVDLRLADPKLRELVERAIESSTQTRLTSERPELIITDKPDAQAVEADAWTLHLINETGASSYLGPFVVDRAHPLTEGLSLGGVVWGAASSQIPGTPIITAGNINLLTDIDRNGQHELRLRLRPELSTLQQTPNWPILISNLIAWRASVAPGLRQANVHLGGEARLAVAPEVQTVSVTDPQNKTREFAARDNVVTIKADLAGVYVFKAGQREYAAAANAISREESDLTATGSGRWGNWANATTLQWEYRSAVWLLLLLALAVLAGHGWLIRERNIN